MSTGKHTPGPWRYSEKHHAIVADCFPDWADPSDQDQEKVTKVCSLIGALGGHNPDADKAAMIAAPDLLAALETLVAYIEAQDRIGARVHPFAEPVMPARAAIARATQ